MRILVCAAVAPLPPTTGLTLVLHALLGEFQRRHDVRVVAYRLPSQSGTPPANVRLIPARHGGPAEMVAAVLRGRPRYSGRLAPGMRAAVRAEIDGFRPDAILLLSGRLAELGPDLLQHPSVLVTLDAVHLGTETRYQSSRGIRRLFHAVELRRVRRFESVEFAHFDRVVVVSDRDREALAGLNPRLKIEVIPNGVDAEFYAPDASIRPDPRRIVFTGVMSSPGNIVAAEFAAREVLPRVRKAMPDAHLALVGRAPPPRVRALAALDGVEVTGEVPDVRPWLTGSRVFLCPMLSGTGIKNKLLEAMAAGMACVATSLGRSGLDVEDGRELLVGDDRDALSARVVEVLSSHELADRLGVVARSYVCNHHSWITSALRYEELLTEVRHAKSQLEGES